MKIKLGDLRRMIQEELSRSKKKCEDCSKPMDACECDMSESTKPTKGSKKSKKK